MENSMEEDPWRDRDGTQHQEGLLVAAEYKGMENTNRGWGYLRANC
jgi:hypothetical protein